MKVHFAGSDNSSCHTAALKAAGVNYALFTCFPYINHKIKEADLRLPLLRENIPGLYKHVIMDSGLFTLMFGAGKAVRRDEQTLIDWQEKLIEFVISNKVNASIVEVDCQKIISSEFAWELRRELGKRLSDHEIINVFHLEDGRKGFEQLCEWSKYIAISVPELRIAQPKRYKLTVPALARRAKQINPELKIHLLGCTEQHIMQRCQFCTSCDSTSWISPGKYGYLKKHHVKNLREDLIQENILRVKSASSQYGLGLSDIAVRDSAKKAIYARYYLALYRSWAGSQD